MNHAERRAWFLDWLRSSEFRAFALEFRNAVDRREFDAYATLLNLIEARFRQAHSGDRRPMLCANCKRGLLELPERKPGDDMPELASAFDRDALPSPDDTVPVVACPTCGFLTLAIEQSW